MAAPIQPWEGRRRATALARVKARGARNQTPCCLCDKPIDYRLTYPDPWSCSVQHIKTRWEHPELTWDPMNQLPAHLRCNWEAPKGPTGSVKVSAPDMGVMDAW